MTSDWPSGPDKVKLGRLRDASVLLGVDQRGAARGEGVGKRLDRDRRREERNHDQVRRHHAH